MCASLPNCILRVGSPCIQVPVGSSCRTRLATNKSRGCPYHWHATSCAGCAGLAALEGSAGGLASLPAGAAARLRRARTWIPELSFPHGARGWPWFPVLELSFSRKAYPGTRPPQHHAPVSQTATPGGPSSGGSCHITRAWIAGL